VGSWGNEAVGSGGQEVSGVREGHSRSGESGSGGQVSRGESGSGQIKKRNETKQTKALFALPEVSRPSYQRRSFTHFMGVPRDSRLRIREVRWSGGLEMSGERSGGQEVSGVREGHSRSGESGSGGQVSRGESGSGQIKKRNETKQTKALFALPEVSRPSYQRRSFTHFMGVPRDSRLRTREVRWSGGLEMSGEGSGGQEVSGVREGHSRSGESGSGGQDRPGIPRRTPEVRRSG
jgi:isopenicillin N synthase-like dioxygenase